MGGRIGEREPAISGRSVVHHSARVVPALSRELRLRHAARWVARQGDDQGGASGARSKCRLSLSSVEVIGITSGRPPVVDRPDGSKRVILTFEGLREAKVRDKDTRLRITLQGPNAARLWRLLGERLADEEKAGA